MPQSPVSLVLRGDISINSTCLVKDAVLQFSVTLLFLPNVIRKRLKCTLGQAAGNRGV